MTAPTYLRTRDLALAGHISVQQVRNYEASGLIPKAQRSPGRMNLRRDSKELIFPRQQTTDWHG
jgi:DNA-binding transcriptional MerR regulator